MAKAADDPFTPTLFTAQSGGLSVRLDHEDGTSLHLHSLVAPEKEGAYFSELRFWGDRIVLAGCGLGYHLTQAMETVGQGSRKILLIEYYPELAERALKLFPGKAREKVTLITHGTDDPEEAIRDFLHGGRLVQMVKHPASFRAHEDFYRKILRECSGGPDRSADTDVALLMTGSFFVEEELKKAVEKTGSSVYPFNYRECTSLVLYEQRLQELLQKACPDILISINMLGFDGNGILTDYAGRAGIPVVVWFVDDPRPILLNQTREHFADITVFCWEKEYLPWLRAQGFSSVSYLPLATDPDQFSGPAEENPTVRCGFAGSSMGAAFLSKIRSKFIWRQEYGVTARSIASRLIENPRTDVDRTLLNAGRFDEHTLTWLRSYTLHMASGLKRRSVINALRETGVETFGDPDGWKELCGPQTVTHPDVDYRTGIAALYKKILVNINITSCQMPSAVNQRVFDVPAAGAFILNDYQTDVTELFSPGEYVTYSDISELPELVDYYSGNEQARRKVIMGARARVLGEHTYVCRFRSVMERL